jgi:hypothetical protein
MRFPPAQSRVRTRAGPYRLTITDDATARRVDPPGGMAEVVKKGKTRFISLSECSAESLRRGSVVHPLVSLQMEYSPGRWRATRGRKALARAHYPASIKEGKVEGQQPALVQLDNAGGSVKNRYPRDACIIEFQIGVNRTEAIERKRLDCGAAPRLAASRISQWAPASSPTVAVRWTPSRGSWRCRTNAHWRVTLE